MVIGVSMGIVRELLKDAGIEADMDLPPLLDGLVFKTPDHTCIGGAEEHGVKVSGESA